MLCLFVAHNGFNQDLEMEARCQKNILYLEKTLRIRILSLDGTYLHYTVGVFKSLYTVYNPVRVSIFPLGTSTT